MANTEMHIKKVERGEFLQPGMSDLYTKLTLTGKDIIYHLLTRTSLISVVIDPHGHWSAMIHTFLFDCETGQPMTFQNSQPAAAEMYTRSMTHSGRLLISKHT